MNIAIIKELENKAMKNLEAAHASYKLYVNNEHKEMAGDLLIIANDGYEIARNIFGTLKYIDDELKYMSHYRAANHFVNKTQKLIHERVTSDKG